MNKILTAVTALLRIKPAHALYCDFIGSRSCGTGCKFHYQCWYSPGYPAYDYWTSCKPHEC